MNPRSASAHVQQAPGSIALAVRSQCVHIQAPDGKTFPSTLPLQLIGVIRAAEFESSIARCSAAFQPSLLRYPALLLGLGGLTLVIGGLVMLA
jgi:hypothetical protein